MVSYTAAPSKPPKVLLSVKETELHSCREWWLKPEACCRRGVTIFWLVGFLNDGGSLTP